MSTESATGIARDWHILRRSGQSEAGLSEFLFEAVKQTADTCGTLQMPHRTRRPKNPLYLRLMRCFVLFLLFLPNLARANDWDALSEPGAIAIMRHALAPGTGDPANLRIGDCSTQRNLDERGRDQARAIGAALRERGIKFDDVLSSQWCRTRETAELLDIGPVTEAPPLNSFFRDFSTRDQQTADTLELIAELDGRLMLVTHQVNISALTGQSTRSGEVLIIRATGDDVEVLGSILIQP
jgi:phosphohistidine phosphatase SixA